MAKINNKTAYPFDSRLSLDDFVIGSDANNLDVTRNYKLGSVLTTFKTSLNLASIEYTFSDGTDPELDENDAGYFVTNANQTSAPAITLITINKIDGSGIDITSLLQVVNEQPTSFTLRISKPSVTGQVFYFSVTAITDNLDNTYSLTVDNFIGSNSLQDGTTYSIAFDLSGVPSIYTESDPIFLASPVGGVTTTQVSNWDIAFGWGNHATEGYLKSVAIGDVTGFIDNSTNWNTAFSWGNHALAGYLTSFTETDPVFSASEAASITAVDTGQWDLAYSWGDHAVAGYITSESDPVFSASIAAGITLLDTQQWDASYSWGDHATAGYFKIDQTTPQTIINGVPDFSLGQKTAVSFYDINYTPTGSEPAGSLFWNSTDETLDLVRNGTVLQLGQELYIRVRNTSAALIENGKVVYDTGHTGIFPDIALAKADADLSGNVLGIATEDIAVNGFGAVTTYGYVRGLKTDYVGTGVWGTTWVEGDILYLSKDVAGQLTNIEPPAPHHSDRVGIVGVVHPAQGTILVGINRHKRLEELSDVNGTALTTSGQVLVWDNVNQYFDFTNNINDYLLNTTDTLTGDLTVTGATDIGGDLSVSVIGSTLTTPRIVGFTDFATNRGVRMQFGDAFNVLQNAFDRGMDIYSYNTLRLKAGSTTSPAALPFQTNIADIGVLIEPISATKKIVARGVAGQSVDIFQVRDSADAVRLGVGATLTTSLNDITVPDETYGVAWNGSTEVPTKNAIYDKIETLGGGAVDSVFGRVGAITAQVGDYSAFYLGIGATAVNSDGLGGKVLTSSGNRFDVIPFVATDGVMEVGKFIDFHGTDADTTDFLTRLEADVANSLKLTGNFTATGQGNFNALFSTNDITRGFDDVSTSGVILKTISANPIIELQRWGGVSNQFRGTRIIKSLADIVIENATLNPTASQTFVERFRFSELGNFTATGQGSFDTIDVTGGSNGIDLRNQSWLNFFNADNTDRIRFNHSTTAGQLDLYHQTGVDFATLRLKNITATGKGIFGDANNSGIRLRHTDSFYWDIYRESATGSIFFDNFQSGNTGNRAILTTSGNFTATGQVTASQFNTLNSIIRDNGSGATVISQNIGGTSGTIYFRSQGNTNTTNELILSTANLTLGGNTIWHAGNDGSGSGLDADLLDGLNSSDFTRLNARSDGYVWIRRNSSGNAAFYVTQQAASGNIVDFRKGGADGATVASIGNAGNITSTSTIASTGNEIRVEGSSPRFRFVETGNTNQWTIIQDANKLFFREDNTANTRLTLEDGGAAVFTSTVTAANFILSSDRNLKKDINPYEAKSIDVDWVTFKWKADELGEEPQLGVIAQDLEKKHPEFVYTNDEGIKSVGYTQLLIAKVAEQEERIEMLEAKLDLILKSL